MAEGSNPASGGCRVDLSGQVALVTGASRGIGRSIALKLASCGAAIAGVARTLEGLEPTLRTIREAGGTAEGYAVNVADSAEVQKAVDDIEAKFQRIHVLVNNAGVTRDGLVLRMDDSAWQEVIDTNLKGTFLFCRAVGVCMMRWRDGRIVNISSVSGLVGNPGQANYSASKAGVIGLSKTIARAGVARNHGQRGGAGVYHDRYDQRAARESQDRGQGANSGSPARNAGGHCRSGLLSRQPECQLCHRPGYRRRRRHDGVKRTWTIPSGHAKLCRGLNDRGLGGGRFSPRAQPE